MLATFDEEKLNPLGKATSRMGVLAYGLTEDRIWVASQVDSEQERNDEAGSARRAYVRVMLSFIEGMTDALKQILLGGSECGRFKLDEAEVHVLREVHFQLDGKFRAKVVRRPMRVKDNVRFTLLLLGRLADKPFVPNFGDQGWASFLEAVVIRNRVTHPRTRDDLWLTNADLDKVNEAVKWFEVETARFLTGFKQPLAPNKR